MIQSQNHVHQQFGVQTGSVHETAGLTCVRVLRHDPKLLLLPLLLWNTHVAQLTSSGGTS